MAGKAAAPQHDEDRAGEGDCTRFAAKAVQQTLCEDVFDAADQSGQQDIRVAVEECRADHPHERTAINRYRLLLEDDRIEQSNPSS